MALVRDLAPTRRDELDDEVSLFNSIVWVFSFLKLDSENFEIQYGAAFNRIGLM